MLSNEEIEERNIEGLEGLDESWEIDYDDLEFGSELARGNFGAVSIANYLGTKVAVKRLFDLDDEMKIYLQRELNVLKQIRHPNVVQFLGLSKTHEGLYLVTEFVNRGDLCRLLYDESEHDLDSMKLRLQISVQCAQGLAYVHAKKLIHRDIKAANYLVGDNWHISLCDFGFSRSIQKPGADQVAGSAMTLCGTDEWMAPETMMGLDYDNTADVFSFGVFLTELMFRAEPKQRSPGTGFRFDEAKFKRDILNKAPETPPELASVVLESTAYDPTQRPAMKVVLKQLKGLASTFEDPEPVVVVVTKSTSEGKDDRRRSGTKSPRNDKKERITKSKKKHKSKHRDDKDKHHDKDSKDKSRRSKDDKREKDDKKHRKKSTS